MSKITNCQECNKEITYTTKKPSLCKECHDKKYGDRKFYNKPKGIPQKSKGEYVLNKILNNIIPMASYIDGGYYSFLPSPKGYPMQLDRYYPRLGLAFEFNGVQHEEDNDYFYKSAEEFAYRQECDNLKRNICAEKNITIIYINHDEELNAKLIIDKLTSAGILDKICSKTLVHV